MQVCQTMTFKPVSFPQGYGMAPNMTVWGGGAIYDGKQYHSYISTMANHCPLSTWGHNSRIDHGVADTIVGPYKFVDVAIPAWSHNSAPISLHDGSYAIVHIGDGTSKGVLTNCNKSHGEVPIEALPLPARRDPAEQGSKETGGSTIHVSKSLAGPWLPLSPNTLGGCNNPAPWVHPNGTIYIVCGGSFKRSESISGPWTTVATFSHSGGPAGNYEDVRPTLIRTCLDCCCRCCCSTDRKASPHLCTGQPFLYTDKRGHYHLIYHGMSINGHAFSTGIPCDSNAAFSMPDMPTVANSLPGTPGLHMRQLHCLGAWLQRGRLHLAHVADLAVRHADRDHKGHHHNLDPGAPEDLLRQVWTNDPPLQWGVLDPGLPAAQRPAHRLRRLQVQGLGLHPDCPACRLIDTKERRNEGTKERRKGGTEERMNGGWQQEVAVKSKMAQQLKLAWLHCS